MAIASRTTTSLTDITQTTIVSALLTAFSNAGYASPVDNYTSGTDRFLVYSFPYNLTKTFGVLYFRLKISSSLVLTSTLYTSWNTTTKAGANPSTEASLATLATTSTINFDALNGGSEYKFVVISQNTICFIAGVICPVDKPGWWDVNAFPYGFIFAAGLSTFLGCNLSPFGNVGYSTFLNNSLLINPNLQNNRRDVLTGIVFISSSGRGVAGKTSDDLAMGCVVGSSRFDILTFPGSTNQYLVINNVAGGLVVRIA